MSNHNLEELPTAVRLRETLQSCEDEPIRIPGSIQRHGFLLLLDAAGEHVIAASENAAGFLEIPLTLILGTPVETLLDRELLGALRSQTTIADNSGLQTYLGSFPLRTRLYSVVTHLVDSERIVEFELLDRLVSPDMANQVFTNFVSKLNSLNTEQSLCQALTEQVKSLTGFNRIMLYRFDDHGHGTVIAEVSDGTLPSYLDLRFPASDIPAQARELYVRNTVRIIPDASYTPSPLHGHANRSVRTLDLSASILRSVSPIHVEYMRNMGTLSSMSVSLILDGKLWGLVSAHHAEPRMVPFLVRAACDLLAKLVCTQLMNFRSANALRKMVHFHAVQRRMLTHMAAESNYLAAMIDQLGDVVRITDADGVALVTDGRVSLFGKTPSALQVNQLVAWMRAHPDLEMFHSGHLAHDIDSAAAFSEVASGMLAIRISHVSQSFLLWFRPEVVSTVKWAGEPPREQKNLTPRDSFESWKELVRGRSNPWSEMEIDSADEFRAAIVTISLKRAEEAAQLSEARFLELTHALPHPVFTAEDGGELTYVNQKWLDQHFRSHGCWFDQPRIPKEDRHRCTELWHAAIASGNPFELEVRFSATTGDDVAPGGINRWNLIRVTPYFRANATRAGWVGTCTDLTDNRQREAALRMTEKLALTGRMTSVIAHEINNPLESLTNLLYLLNDHVRHDPTARSYIGLAESELQRISGITKQTLRWSREGVLKAQYTTAGALFDDVLRLFAGQIRNREVTVTIAGGEDVRLFGTIGQLGQVMANLVSNAVQAVPVGGHISLSAIALGDTPGGESMEIIIRDQGHGMSEEALRNLFQPFYSTKGDLGNGLGLYISHEIVERNNGTLTITSQLGAGTEARVRLPAIAPTP